MKILLVQPARPEKAMSIEDFEIFEPLALEYLAAGVAGEHDVRILDMRLEKNLDFMLNDYRPDVVGITSYTVHVNTVTKLFKRIKGFNPEIYTVIGGHHATVIPEDFFSPDIDAIIQGEGVFSFRELINRLERKKGFSDIPGVVRIENGTRGILIKEENKMPDLDAIPFPDRKLTTPYRSSYSSAWMKPIASIRTSKGCIYKCTFCALWKLTGGRYLVRKPEHILEELGAIEESNIFFADDESLLDTDRMETLADMIMRSGIKKRYFLYGRSDTIAGHPELIERWRKIGLERVFVGLEFFKDADLKAVRKGTTAEKNAEALRILKSLDIDIYPVFMIKPEFERKDFSDLRKYCLKLELDFIGFSVLTPLPGTDFYEDVREKMITSNYDYFDFIHTQIRTKLPLNDFFRELADLYKNSRSLKNQIKYLRKFPVRELPHLISANSAFMKRLKTLANDYNV